MQQKIQLFSILIALFFLSVLTGCETSHQYVSRKPVAPKFMDNIYMNHHDKTAITANLIAPKKLTEIVKVEPPVAENNPYADAEASIAPTTVAAPKRTHESWTVSSSVVEAKKTALPVNTLQTPETANSLLRDSDNPIVKKYTQMVGISPSDINNVSLYNFIDKWYGTDYRLGGSDNSGIDCSGFVQKLYGEVFGMDLLRTAMEQFKNCKRIKHADGAAEGDLVFFHVHGRRITHVGVYLGNNYFVHASSSQGVVISNLNEDYWHKYFAGCGRIPKSAN